MTSRAEVRFTSRRWPSGVSPAPYDSANLAAHVGDDPGHVEANRVALAAEVRLPRDHLRFMQQVHGGHVAVVDAPSRDEVPGTDALVTATPGLGLVVLVADCVPVVLADESAGVIAAVHAGRNGVAGDIVSGALAAMAALGATEVRASVGPSVCGACYEVPPELHDEVAGLVPATAGRTRWGTPGLDLPAGVIGQLTAGGVTRVDHDPRCTLEDPDLFSHRRDGVTGRFAGIAVLRA